jgi:hypothetical protein
MEATIDYEKKMSIVGLIGQANELLRSSVKVSGQINSSQDNVFAFFDDLESLLDRISYSKDLVEKLYDDYPSDPSKVSPEQEIPF